MGQLVCRFDDKFHCTFAVSPVLDDLVNEKSAGALVIRSIAFLSVFILWILTFIIRHVDHTRAYLTNLLIPTTIYTILTWLETLFKFIHNDVYAIGGYENAFIGLVIYISDFQCLLGTMAFLLFNIGTACSRNEPGPVITWITFLLSLFLSGAFITAGYFLNVPISLVPVTMFIFSIGCVILACLTPLIACCCSGPKVGQSSSPVVANAKSRMVWALVFAIPMVLIVMIKYFVYFRYAGKSGIFGNAQALIITLTSYIQPILLLLAAVLFLPAYRSALCCSQGPTMTRKVQKNDKVLSHSVKSNVNGNQQQIPSKSAIVQQQVPCDQTTQGPIDPNLIAYLTNPSLMNTINVQNQTSSPRQQLTGNDIPNCNHVAYPPYPQAQGSHVFQSVQEPVTLLHVPNIQDVSNETWAIAVPQQNVIVTQPSGMVHYASQPNLVQYSTPRQQGLSVQQMTPMQTFSV